MADLIVQVGPRLRRAVDAELEAVQHDLDAGQIWKDIQAEAKRRVGEFQGSTEAEFGAWAERLALRHIRYSVSGRAASIETIVSPPKIDTVAKPAPSPEFDPNATLAPDSPEMAKFDPNATLAPGDNEAAQFDPNATIAPGSNDTTKFDPNATLAPGAGDTIGPDAFAIPQRDPHATITDLHAIPLAPQTTKIFGDYEILETIAKGGMGVVYKARQRKLNRIVALKMILAGQFADEGDIERFYVEAEAAAQLRHPNIVGIFEVGECEGQHYFSMEYIEGRSLGDLVREHPLEPRDAARFVKTISEAMHYAHEKGVLHRDLKPSNVLVDNNDEPLITDFGLAKRTEEQSMRTAAGSILGTPSYMPPEQASGKLDLISERSDVYSIGAILYELNTGKPPFGAPNPWETIKQVISDEPVSPRLLNNSVPVDLETICLKCLQKDQARRYHSAQDLADELERFLAGEPILARPIGIVERVVRWCYRNPWPTVAMGVMLLGVVGTSVGLREALKAKSAAKASEKTAIDERGKAEVAQKAAEASEVKAVLAKDQAEKGRDQLMEAINELFTAWGDVTLLNTPGLEEVRAKLLATAKDLYERMGDELGADPKVQEGLGEAYFRLGRLMFYLDSYVDAQEALEAGVAVQRSLHAELPDDDDRLHALGETLNQLGKVLELSAKSANADVAEVRDRLATAEARYDEAIALREELVNRHPENPEYKRQLLNSRMNKHWLPQIMGDRLADQSQQAEEFYERSRPGLEDVQAGLFDLLAQLDGNTDVRREVVQDLAQCSYNLANVTWWLGDIDATVEHASTAVQKFGELLFEDPKNLQNQFDQAQCRMLFGDAKSEQMRWASSEQIIYIRARVELTRIATPEVTLLQPRLDDLPAAALCEAVRASTRQKLDAEVLPTLERAKKTLNGLATDSPKVSKYRYLEAQAWMRIGDFHYVAERDDEALAAYESAAGILKPLVAEFPDYQRLLDQADSNIADVERYIKETTDAPPPTEVQAPK